MAISYTIREVQEHQLIVDYADGSWAVVPIAAGMSKEQIEDGIGQFSGQVQFASLADVPFEKGDQGVVLSKEEVTAAAQEAGKSRLLNYAELRQLVYPSLGDQLDAAYWSRQGDDTAQQEIDQSIAETKAMFPKDMEPIKQSEIDAFIEAASS